MSIKDKITVNAHYTRSVNLERDANSAGVVQGYIPTTLALKTLDRMVEAMASGAVPRAWTLIGPYGSGKSSFAASLLSYFPVPNRRSRRWRMRCSQGRAPKWQSGSECFATARLGIASFY